MSLLRQIFGPSKEEIWRELSRQIGAEFVDGGFWKGSKVVAETGPWTVTLDTYTVSTGKSSVTYTRLRAPYVNRDGFRFHLYRAGIFSEIGKLLGMQDIQIGDSEFDRQFIVKSSLPDQARTLLANEELRSLLMKQPAVSFSVVDDEGWFGQHFPEGVDELHFQVVGIIKDVDRLKLLFDLFSETLDTLCVIGSAYETPPFQKVDIPDEDRLLRSSQPSGGDDLLRPAAGGEQTDTALLPRPADAPNAEVQDPLTDARSEIADEPGSRQRCATPKG